MGILRAHSTIHREQQQQQQQSQLIHHRVEMRMTKIKRTTEREMSLGFRYPFGLYLLCVCVWNSQIARLFSFIFLRRRFYFVGWLSAFSSFDVMLRAATIFVSLIAHFTSSLICDKSLIPTDSLFRSQTFCLVIPGPIGNAKASCT